MSANMHIAFLRGINVGSRNKLPMRVLRAVFEEAGCRDVQTYVQSGNVVFHPPASLKAPLAHHLQAAVSRCVGTQIPVVLRTAAQLAASVENNPLLAGRVDPKSLHVGFLASPPTKTQLTVDYFDRALDTVSTVRNWNTVQRLLAMCTP